MVLSCSNVQELCGLSVLVEFKVDSFRAEDEDILPGPAERKLSNVDVENPENPETEGRSSKMLRVLAQHGHQIPHEFLVDLRTRSTRSFHALGPTDVYNHAIWSRTPTTIVALHTFGTFEKEEVFKFEDLEERYEAEAVQDGVRKVGYLLKEIISTLKNKPVGSKYSLVCMTPVGRKLALREGGRGAGIMVDSTA